MTLRHEFYEHEEISVLSFSMKRIYSPFCKGEAVKKLYKNVYA